MSESKAGKPITFRHDEQSAAALDRILSLAPDDPDYRGSSVTDLMRELVIHRDKLIETRRWIREQRPDGHLIPIQLVALRLQIPSYFPDQGERTVSDSA